MNRNLRIFRDWSLLSAYLLTIFITFPLVEHLVRQSVQKSVAFSEAVSASVIFYIASVAVSLALYVILADKRFRILRLIALGAIVAAGLYGQDSLKMPYDKLHIVQYSVLAFLLFRVLRFYNHTTALYLWCVIFIGIAGCADELMQYFIPGRSSSLKDLRIDIYASALTVLSIFLVICPRLERWRLKMDFFVRELHMRERWLSDYKKRRHQ